MEEHWPAFEVLRRLGEGGSGTVDEVQVLGKYPKKLALKTVVWEGKENADILQHRAFKEMAILKQMWHPCLPKLYGFKSTSSYSQILMTQAECGDLQQIQNSPCAVKFSEHQIRLYAAEILLALEDLHNNGIVYADLKPENVIVRPCGHVMLCDFDMSLMKAELEEFQVASQDAIAAQTRCVGTLEFCAPEIITNGMLGYSDVSDYWGLGVLIYEMLFGKNPFAGHSMEQTMTRIVSQSPRIPEGSNCSPELRTFLNGLLRHDPVVRLGSSGVESIKNHAWFHDFSWEEHMRELMRCDVGK